MSRNTTEATLNAAQIRLMIDEELNHSGLTADIEALAELGLLLGENRDCDPQRLGHMIGVMVDNARRHIVALNQLNKQLQ